jgi:pyruvate-formate lyase-activating enzyme
LITGNIGLLRKLFIYTINSIYAKSIQRYKISRGYPADVNFELTTACNLRCKYCPRNELVKKGVRSVGHMDYDLIGKIVKDLSKISDKKFNITPLGLGEPLLFPGLCDVLKTLRLRFPKANISINTNALLLDEETSKELIKTGIDEIVFSINIWDREKYKVIHGVDALPLVIENVKRFLQLKGAGKPHAIVQILDIDVNKGRIDWFYRYWKRYLNRGDSIYIRPINDFGGRVSLKDFVSIPKQRNRFPCPELFSTVMVNKDGFIFPCCMGVAYSPDVDICLGNTGG